MEDREKDIKTKKRHTLGKGERLCSLKAIEALFASGSRVGAYPLHVVYGKVEGAHTAAIVLFSVSKKRFKRAVDRNRVKRLMRESYRLNKASLYAAMEEKGCALNIGFVYVDTALPDYRQVETAMKKALAKIIGQIKTDATSTNVCELMEN